MKKAQIKMFETIGVLVIFFFLLVAGASFYFKMQESALEREVAKQAQLRSLQAAQRATYLPELDCSLVGVQRENCFDRVKLRVFPEVASQQAEEYFWIFGYANITVRELYPEQGAPVPVYDYPLQEYKHAPKSLVPVLVYDPFSRAYSFAVMEVTTYVQ
jgi:hypothetical protein